MTPEIKIRQVLIEAIYRRKSVFLTVFFGIVALTILIILFMPRQYQSDARLIVENLRPHSSLSAQPVDKVVMNDDVTEMQINSEVELIRSEGVLRKALHLPSITPQTSIGEMTAEQKPLKTLATELSVDPVRQTSIINVSLRAKSPEDAVRNLNAILNAYFEQRASLTRSSGAAEFFNQQASEIGAKLETGRAALSTFEAEHELVNLDDQKKLQIQRIATLDDQLGSTRTALADQSGRAADLKRQQAETTPRTTTTERSLTNQYSQERLSSLLVDLENRRSELLERYQPTDLLIVELDQKIATTRAAIDYATRYPATDRATDVNPVWQQIVSLRTANGAAIAGTSAEQAELVRERKLAEDRLSELLAVTGQYEDLSRRFQEAQTDYNIDVQKRDEARISEALDREKVFNVSLIQVPISSSKPVRPRSLTYLLAGLLGAFSLACALALYVDASGERIYAPHQLDDVTGSQTLATIREMPASETEAVDPNRRDSALFEYRTLLYSLRGSLGGAGQSGRGASIAFTSTLPGEGVSLLTRRLAMEAARQSSQRIALLDVKLLQRDFSEVEAVPVGVRLNPDGNYWELVVGQELRSDDRLGQFALGQIRGDSYQSDIDAIFARLHQEFSLVLLDCPSLRRSTLAIELDRVVSGYVVVVSLGMASKRQLSQIGILLGKTRVPTLGYVLNRRSYPVPGWLYRALWQETPA